MDAAKTSKRNKQQELTKTINDLPKDVKALTEHRSTAEQAGGRLTTTATPSVDLQGIVEDEGNVTPDEIPIQTTLRR